MKTISKYYSKMALLLIAITGCCLVACDDDTEETVSFGVSQHELNFLADGGTDTLSLYAGEAWNVSSDTEWCRVTPASGMGSADCKIYVDSSYLYREREAHLTFRCGRQTRQITISQLGYEKVIKLEKEEIEVADFTEYGKMFEKVKVVSNVDYEVELVFNEDDQQDWLKATAGDREVTSVPRESSVRLDFDLYTASDKDRTATVIFRQTDAAEDEMPVESRLTFRQKKAQEIIPSRAGDSLALLAISRVMKCYVSWDASQSMIHWPNIKMENVTYINHEGKEVTEQRVVAASFVVFNTDQSIPYQIEKLDQLRTLSFTGNENAYLKNIKLEDHVTRLPHLKRLSLIGYGITELPENMKNMTELEELVLSGNKLTEIPMDIISALDEHKLEYINLSNNRRVDVGSRLYDHAESKDTLGLHGEIPEALFRLKNVKHIYLSYNYFEGKLPDMGWEADEIGRAHV